VIFFRASTGLLRLSQNTAFGLLASWGLQLAGVPVIHFVCQTGMSRCVQGTNKYDHLTQPPCAACIGHSAICLLMHRCGLSNILPILRWRQHCMS